MACPGQVHPALPQGRIPDRRLPLLFSRHQARLHRRRNRHPRRLHRPRPRLVHHSRRNLHPPKVAVVLSPTPRQPRPLRTLPRSLATPPLIVLEGARSYLPNSVIPTGADHREGDDLRSGGTWCCNVTRAGWLMLSTFTRIGCPALLGSLERAGPFDALDGRAFRRILR